jgi:DnaJ-class molecular chaperone
MSTDTNTHYAECERCDGQGEVRTGAYSYAYGPEYRPCPDCAGRPSHEPEDYEVSHAE